jgi:hypothetical protein
MAGRPTVTCPYITSLDRPCGRDATHNDYCGLHLALSAIDSLDSVEDLFHVLEGMNR